jgi:uncharacterized membrane protein
VGPCRACAAAWALVYGSFYLFLIALPVFVVRQEEHIRRTVLAYLTVWIAAYVCFLAYPTMASRPAEVIGEGFAVWGVSAFSTRPTRRTVAFRRSTSRTPSCPR